jgi:hypothetical protein
LLIPATTLTSATPASAAPPTATFFAIVRLIIATAVLVVAIPIAVAVAVSTASASTAVTVVGFILGSVVATVLVVIVTALAATATTASATTPAAAIAALASTTTGFFGHVVDGAGFGFRGLGLIVIRRWRFCGLCNFGFWRF